MQIGMIENHTRVCGKEQGYAGLPIRDETLQVDFGDDNIQPVNQMTSAWLPTPDEITRIQNGAAIHVKIWGVTPAPMLVEVGEAPEHELTREEYDRLVDKAERQNGSNSDSREQIKTDPAEQPGDDMLTPDETP